MKPYFRWLATTAATLGMMSLASVTSAQTISPSVEHRLKTAIEQHTQGKVPVDAITATPMSGIYQVTSNNELFYTDASGRYGFVGGSLVDMQTQADLTAAAQDHLMRIPFDRLPLQHAIKEVHGNGSRTLAVFEDPNCPICRVFAKFLAQVEDVTIYRFMFPVIAPESQSLARVAWCSGDRTTVWNSIMNGSRPNGNESCNIDGLVEILRLGEQYQINNTPTVVLASGKRLVGATPPEQFLAELERGGQLP